MAALATRLEGIDGTGTYNSDIGGRVYRGKILFDDADTFPVLTMEDNGTTNDSAENHIYCRVKALKRVSIHGLVDVDDTDNPNDNAYLLISDIKKSIFTGDERLAGEAITITYTGSSVSAREDSATKVGCSVDITISYAENLLDP